MLVPELEPVRNDEFGRLLHVSRRGGVVNRLRREARIEEPLRRRGMELGHEIRLGGVQLVAEELAEEMVVAVPLASGVERNEKEVRAGDAIECPRRRRAAGDGVAKRAAEAIEDG